MNRLLPLCILCATAVPAGAADLFEPSLSHVTAAAAPVVWARFYTGVEGGYDWGLTTHSFSNGAPSGNSHPSGGFGGAYAGYNFQVGRFITGLEGDIKGA